MRTFERKINNEIQEYSKKQLLSTDNISDGTYTFKELYDRIFNLEQELVRCKEHNNNFIKELY